MSPECKYSNNPVNRRFPDYAVCLNDSKVFLFGTKPVKDQLVNWSCTRAKHAKFLQGLAKDPHVFSMFHNKVVFAAL